MSDIFDHLGGRYIGGCDQPYTASAEPNLYPAFPPTPTQPATVALYAHSHTIDKSVHIFLTPEDARAMAVRLLLSADMAESATAAAERTLVPAGRR